MFKKMHVLLVSSIFVFSILLGCGYSSSSDEGQANDGNAITQEDGSIDAADIAAKTEDVVEASKADEQPITDVDTKENIE